MENGEKPDLAVQGRQENNTVKGRQNTAGREWLHGEIWVCLCGFIYTSGNDRRSVLGD